MTFFFLMMTGAAFACALISTTSFHPTTGLKQEGLLPA
jgi:hypothetical protein